VKELRLLPITQECKARLGPSIDCQSVRSLLMVFGKTIRNDSNVSRVVFSLLQIATDLKNEIHPGRLVDRLTWKSGNCETDAKVLKLYIQLRQEVSRNF